VWRQDEIRESDPASPSFARATTSFARLQ